VPGITPASLGPVDHAGDLVNVDEHMGDLQVTVREHRSPQPERCAVDRVPLPGSLVHATDR